ncbi:MAG: hypothetical protein LUF90_08960 [Rikenellaceae bacterium]|nr:hypothetical protein [Rikenellaceae bacterium]
MKKSEIEAVNELTRLMGYKSWFRTKHSCTGKWRGTTDYSLVFDSTIRLSVSNGMKNFETQIKKYISWINNINNYRSEYIDFFEKRIKIDNDLAIKENLQQVEILDVDINLKSESHLLWSYVKIKVGKREVKHLETMLDYRLKKMISQIGFTLKRNYILRVR